MSETKVKEITQERFEEIVEAVHNELLDAPDEEQAEFLWSGLNGHDLATYHSTLGRYIRNKYELWQYEWTPEYDDNMVDHSKFHPDNISMEIIKQVWLKGNGKSV